MFAYILSVSVVWGRVLGVGSGSFAFFQAIIAEMQAERVDEDTKKHRDHRDVPSSHTVKKP